LLSEEELEKVHLLSVQLRAVWEAPTTTSRDRKRLLRCLIEEVQLRTEEHYHAVRIVWKGGAVTDREVVRGKPGWATRTAQDTVALVRELAAGGCADRMRPRPLALERLERDPEHPEVLVYHLAPPRRSNRRRQQRVRPLERAGRGRPRAGVQRPG
jgi:hypothetical protein